MADQPTTTGDWRTLDRRLLVDRSPYARVYDEDVQLPNGEIIKNFVRVELPDFVIMFVLTQGNHVAFVRQHRQAVGGDTLELPAGHMEDGEDPLAAAQRELREETGLASENWQSLGKYMIDPNRYCGWAYLYFARDAQIVAAADHGDLDTVTVEFLPLDEVRRIWLKGELISAPTTLCIGLALAVLSS
ncbi:MAG: NUDIX hydrolase [Chloroflexota bacterium]